MKSRFSALMVFAVVAFCACPAQAGDGWSLSKLNPFKKKPTASQRARASFTDEASQTSRFPRVSMPSWGQQSQTPRPTKKPSTLSKMNQGTKDLLGKTKDTLMPWSKDAKKKSDYTRSSKKSSSPFSLTSWLPKKKKEEKSRSKSMTDFLGQPRPSF